MDSSEIPLGLFFDLPKHGSADLSFSLFSAKVLLEVRKSTARPRVSAGSDTSDRSEVTLPALTVGERLEASITICALRSSWHCAAAAHPGC